MLEPRFILLRPFVGDGPRLEIRNRLCQQDILCLERVKHVENISASVLLTLLRCQRDKTGEGNVGRMARGLNKIYEQQLFSRDPR